MIGKRLIFSLFILIVSHANVSANSLNASSNSKKATADSQTTDPPCLNPQYEYKKFRPKTMKNLPFPPGAIVVVSKCMDEGIREKISTEEKLNQAEIDKEIAIKKLSLLLSFIYHQQKNLAGSYKETGRSYDDLAQKNAHIPKVYERAVTKYENSLKSYGEYQAYLSALPRAVSDYEKRAGSAFKDFALQNEDGVITMMKTAALSQFSESLGELNAKLKQPTALVEALDENSEEKSGDAKDKEQARQNLCMLMGASGGVTAVENFILATLSNPLSAVLGISLGATLCSENIYGKLSLWSQSFGAKVMGVGANIRDNLEAIGNGLYDIGKKYLYVSPSKAGEKISEHFKNAKSWLNRKLGWQ
jgi:hypothetical protein